MTRALHYVFKIADRKMSRDFFVNILKMKVLRHEEFEEGCKATCNGPYNGRWSKTMVGYGSEDDHFVLELTYNYPIASYKLGNDFGGICIRSTDVFESCKNYKKAIILASGEVEIEDPDGHKFYILPHGPELAVADPIYKVKLNTPDQKETLDYWTKLLSFAKVKHSENSFIVSTNGKKKFELEWDFINDRIDRRTGFGRIAFAVPVKEESHFLKFMEMRSPNQLIFYFQLESIQKKIEEAKQKILTPLVKLDTPGKAAVEVIILADPNDHEICFVGDEAFRELSQIDLDADIKLLEAIDNDKSEKYKIPA
uniref:Glyoxalase domain-containing protein 4 n=1 Tax=Elaeophora elaphi TaxID=1147741 RepID=A0A0R3RJF3_9BILA